MADMQKQYITPETKQKLEDELNALIAHRPVVAAEINERREEGDLKENAGYDAAREMQDQEEARIKQISEILANSTTERSGIEEGVAHIGSVVHVYYNGDENDKETFLIGTRAAASDNKDLETYSEQSPLGAAVLGAREGDTREYTAPNGVTNTVTSCLRNPTTRKKPRHHVQPPKRREQRIPINDETLIFVHCTCQRSYRPNTCLMFSTTPGGFP